MFNTLKTLSGKIARSIYRYFVDNRIIPQIGSALLDGLSTLVSLAKLPIIILSILTSGFSTAWLESVIMGGVLTLFVVTTLAVKLGLYYPLRSFAMPMWIYSSLIAFIANTGIRQIYKTWRLAHV